MEIKELFEFMKEFRSEMIEQFERRFAEQHKLMVALNDETRGELGAAIAELSSKLDNHENRIGKLENEMTYVKSDIVVLKSSVEHSE